MRIRDEIARTVGGENWMEPTTMNLIALQIRRP